MFDLSSLNNRNDKLKEPAEAEASEQGHQALANVTPSHARTSDSQIEYFDLSDEDAA